AIRVARPAYWPRAARHGRNASLRTPRSFAAATPARTMRRVVGNRLGRLQRCKRFPSSQLAKIALKSRFALYAERCGFRLKVVGINDEPIDQERPACGCAAAGESGKAAEVERAQTATNLGAGLHDRAGICRTDI